MSKKIIVIIEDDWELRGNGLGKVSHLQYEPSQFLMSLCEKLGFRMTFMVEVMQQFVMKSFRDENPELAEETTLWEKNVNEMVERGFDIQLHLHPQWHNAKYENGFFYLSNNWNIAAYDRDARLDMLVSGKEYLESFYKSADVKGEIIGFKAGSWGTQPSRMLLEDLEEIGIKVVMGVRKDLYYQSENFQLDYRNLEESILPYHPDYDDITKVSKEKKSLWVLPLTPYDYSPSIKWQRLKEKLKLVSGAKKTYTEISYPYYSNIPEKIKNLSPLKETDSFFSKILNPVTAHLNFENEFEENKLAIDQIMKSSIKRDDEIVPFVIETHTKGYEGKYENVEKALTYLVEKFGSMIEFQTVAEFYNRYLGDKTIKKTDNNVIS